MAGNPSLTIGLALALLLADVAVSSAQELPSGGGPLPSLRRGANGQIEVAPEGTVAHPPTGKRSAAPAAAAPNPSLPKAGREVAAPAVRAPTAAKLVLPIGPRPVITVVPHVPSVPDTTPRGTVVATYSVKMSDNSPFAGTVRFGPPYFDYNRRFALRDDNIIVNPDGPGLGPNKKTITGHVTLEAIPESQPTR